MADPQFQQDQVQSLLSDFNTRLRDLDERSRLIRERVLLIGKNLIASKQELEEDIREIKKNNVEIKRDIEKLKTISKNILTETSKFVKHEEIRVIERMLQDFQPLEFLRKKDIEELIDKKLAEKDSKKQIKTTLTKK